MQRGRPRKLREESLNGDPKPPLAAESNVGNGQKFEGIVTEALVKTQEGTHRVPVDDFNMGTLDYLQPYDGTLPLSITTKGRNGRPRLVKEGEPRFYFNGNELIKTYRSTGGSKKRSLYWLCKPNHKKLGKQHIQIKKYLLNREIPQLG